MACRHTLVVRQRQKDKDGAKINTEVEVAAASSGAGTVHGCGEAEVAVDPADVRSGTCDGVGGAERKRRQTSATLLCDEVMMVDAVMESRYLLSKQRWG